MATPYTPETFELEVLALADREKVRATVQVLDEAKSVLRALLEVAHHDSERCELAADTGPACTCGLDAASARARTLLHKGKGGSRG